jgi:hypothetical protein
MVLPLEVLATPVSWQFKPGLILFANHFPKIAFFLEVLVNDQSSIARHDAVAG